MFIFRKSTAVRQKKKHHAENEQEEALFSEGILIEGLKGGMEAETEV